MHWSSRRWDSWRTWCTWICNEMNLRKCPCARCERHKKVWHWWLRWYAWNHKAKVLNGNRKVVQADFAFCKKRYETQTLPLMQRPEKTSQTFTKRYWRGVGGVPSVHGMVPSFLLLVFASCFEGFQDNVPPCFHCFPPFFCRAWHDLHLSSKLIPVMMRRTEIGWSI